MRKSWSHVTDQCAVCKTLVDQGYPQTWWPQCYPWVCTFQAGGCCHRRYFLCVQLPIFCWSDTSQWIKCESKPLALKLSLDLTNCSWSENSYESHLLKVTYFFMVNNSTTYFYTTTWYTNVKGSYLQKNFIRKSSNQQCCNLFCRLNLTNPGSKEEWGNIAKFVRLPW